MREIYEFAFSEADLEYRDYGRIDERFLSPGSLVGDATKARTVLGRKPACTFSELVPDLVQNDLRLASI